MNQPFKKNHYVKTTVGAIISRQSENGEQILLTRRGVPPYLGKWCLPGGHIDLNESAQDAIIREVKEEVGLTFDACFLGYFDEIIPENDIHAVVLIFTGNASGEPRAQPDEVTEMQWFLLKEISSLSMAFQHNQILDSYQDKISAK